MRLRRNEKRRKSRNENPEKFKEQHDRATERARINNVGRSCRKCGVILTDDDIVAVGGNGLQCRGCKTKYNKSLRSKLKFKDPLKWKTRMIYISLHGYGIKASNEYIQNIIEKTPTCVYCLIQIPLKDYSVDHIIPRSRGGTDTLNNIHLICKSCNFMKGSLLDNEFRQLLDWLNDKPEIYKILKQRLKASGFMYLH